MSLPNDICNRCHAPAPERPSAPRTTLPAEPVREHWHWWAP
jgi:hypothetical protein